MTLNTMTRMTIWTIVEESFDVVVCPSLKAVLEQVDYIEFALAPESTEKATSKAFEESLRTNRSTRLYPMNDGESARDWLYRIDRHDVR